MNCSATNCLPFTVLLIILLNGCSYPGMHLDGIAGRMQKIEIPVEPGGAPIVWLNDSTGMAEECVAIDTLVSSFAPFGEHSREFVEKEAIEEAGRDGADAIVNFRVDARARMVANAPNQYEEFATGKLVVFKRNITCCDTAEVIFNLPEGLYYSMWIRGLSGSIIEHVERTRRNSFSVNTGKLGRGLFGIRFEAAEKVGEESWSVKWTTSRWIEVRPSK